MDIICFCVWYLVMEEGSRPMLSLSTCFFLWSWVPGIVYLCNLWTPSLVTLHCPFWSLLHYVWYQKKRQQRLNRNTHSCPAWESQCKLLVAHNLQFVASWTITRRHEEVLEGTWISGFVALQWWLSHAKTQCRSSKQARSPVDMTLGRQPKVRTAGKPPPGSSASVNNQVVVTAAGKKAACRL